jgi:hypothetical protein
MTPEELQKVSDSMETWSVLCLNGLTSITKQNLGLIA